MNVEEVSSVVVDTAFHLHRDLGPGLLESVYEAVLARMLEERGVRVDGCLVIELKSVEKLAPVHAKQLLTYLRLLNLPVGLLINFGAATFKEGIRRVVNKHQDFASSRLRVNKKVGGTRRCEGGFLFQGIPKYDHPHLNVTKVLIGITREKIGPIVRPVYST